MRSIVFALSLGIFAVACTSSGDDADSAANDLSGPVSTARACAVKKVYAAASLSSLTPISKSDLPSTITTTNPLSLSYLDVPQVDRVYIVEEAASTSFYDRRGLLVARATNSDPIVWSGPTGALLVCEGDAPSPSSGLAVQKLVEGDDKVLLGLAGDDAIYRTVPADAGGTSKLYAAPLAGGTPTFVADLASADSLTISNGVVAHWRAITNGIGTLDVWSRRTGLSASVATASPATSLRASADGKRIAFGENATLAGTKPNSMAIAVRDLGATTNAIVMDGPYRANLAAGSSCPVQISFAGGSLFAEYCGGASASETRARLVMLPSDSTSLQRLDGATLDSANALAGNVKFSVDESGQHIVAAGLSGAGPRGVVYNIGVSGYVQLPQGTDYTMLSHGKAVLYRTAANELMSAQTASGGSALLAKDVRGVLAVSRDGKAALFNRKDRDPSTGLIDINLVHTSGPTDTEELTTSGLSLGFSGDSKRALFLAAPSGSSANAPLLSVTLDDGSIKPLMPNAAGGRTTGSAGVIAFSNVKAGGSTMPTVAEISYVDANGVAQSLATDVPVDASDTEVFVSDHHVAFTNLKAGAEGIFGVQLP